MWVQIRETDNTYQARGRTIEDALKEKVGEITINPSKMPKIQT